MVLDNPDKAALDPVDVIIIGAGPSGLSAAIAASRAGLSYRVIEKGALVNSIYGFPRNMVFFTTPELLEIGGIPFTTPNEKPTRQEALRYYRKVTDSCGLRIQFDECVAAVCRSGSAPDALFRVSTGRFGESREYFSHNVVMATGYYDQPNLLGIPGENLPQVFHYYSEPHPYYRKKVIVVGGKNSAAEAALDLYRNGASVILIHRGERLGDSIKYWVRPDIRNRIKEGSIKAYFNTRLVQIKPDVVLAESAGQAQEIPYDAVFLLTGYRPDIRLLEGAGVRISSETLEPEHNHDTFETNVSGIYLAGALVAGRETNRVFIENGRFHGEKVIASILQKRQGAAG
jgi:thioredoxin reductase (NADPH)